MILPILAALVLMQAPGDSLSLRDALSHARNQRAQVRASAALVEAARAGFRVAGTIPNPVASYGHTEDPPRQHASLDQSFDWLLTRGADRRAAGSGVRRAAADSAQLAADLAAEVRRAFYGVVAARELERVAGLQAVLADSLAELARRRVERGDIAEVERDQLVLEATRARQRRSRAHEAATVAWTRLARAIAWGENPPMAVRGRLDDALVPAGDASPARPTLDATPSIISAVAESTSAAERARRAGLARVPLPSLTAGADWDDPGGKSGALAVLGISLPLPLWQHGDGALALARAEAAQAAAATAEARLEAAQRFAEAEARLRESVGRALIARDSLLPVAQRLRERATTAYQAGETGVIPLLEALRAERDVAAEAVDDLLTFQEARAEWNRTVGVAE